MYGYPAAPVAFCAAALPARSSDGKRTDDFFAVCCNCSFIQGFARSFPRYAFVNAQRRPFQGQRLTYAATANANDNGATGSRTAIIWFKKDLRIDDHPGLMAADSYDSIVPLYILDPSLLRGWPTKLLEALVEALKNQKVALQGLGSDLIIRRGSIQHELSLLAQEVQSNAIISEEEVEHSWRTLPASISGSYQEKLLLNPVQHFETWSAPLYNFKEKQSLSLYTELRRMKCPVNLPLAAPTSLPALPKELDKGEIPSVASILEDIHCAFKEDSRFKNLGSIRTDSAEALLTSGGVKKQVQAPSETKVLTGILEGFFEWRQRYILASPYEALERRREELAIQANEKAGLESPRVGVYVTLDALNGYLRFLEPTRRNDWKKLHEEVLVAEYKGARGTSFRTLFRNALILGTISRRRIYHEAFEYEKGRNGGFNSPFGFSTFTAAAAVQEIKSIEWYRMLAAVTEEESKERGWQVKTWIWRGFHIQYNTMGTSGPPIVLVHGFGAFWEHYRDNIKGLAEVNRVWALTLLGFGRSEKPNVVYTELFWAEMIRDFIVEVVGEPASLVGNSIGGYMVSVVAGLWPPIVKNLILLNSAGAVVPNYLSFKYLLPKGRTGATRVAAQLLMLFLKWSSTRLLKKCYCVNPLRADDWLAEEVLRAAYDPGAESVIESVFCLRRPLPLNWFIDRYKDKVFVIQGMKDPLSNGVQRTELLKLYCRNVVIKPVNAGHCPHDEIPDEVNQLLLDWLQETGSMGTSSIETATPSRF